MAARAHGRSGHNGAPGLFRASRRPAACGGDWPAAAARLRGARRTAARTPWWADSSFGPPASRSASCGWTASDSSPGSPTRPGQAASVRAAGARPRTGGAALRAAGAPARRPAPGRPAAGGGRRAGGVRRRDPEGFSSAAHQFDSDITVGRYPRAALGLTAERLVALVCDGRSEEDSGLTLAELASLMTSAGCLPAIRPSTAAGPHRCRARRPAGEPPARGARHRAGGGPAGVDRASAVALMRVPWKLIGLAGLAGVAATGVVVARRGARSATTTPTSCATGSIAGWPRSRAPAVSDGLPFDEAIATAATGDVWLFRGRKLADRRHPHGHEQPGEPRGHGGGARRPAAAHVARRARALAARRVDRRAPARRAAPPAAGTRCPPGTSATGSEPGCERCMARSSATARTA